MAVLITCKNEEDPIKNESAKVVTTLTSIFRCSKAANSVVGGGLGPEFKLIQAFMIVLVTFKNDEDQSKNELTRVLTEFLPL